MACQDERVMEGKAEKSEACQAEKKKTNLWQAEKGKKINHGRKEEKKSMVGRKGKKSWVAEKKKKNMVGRKEKKNNHGWLKRANHGKPDKISYDWTCRTTKQYLSSKVRKIQEVKEEEGWVRKGKEKGNGKGNGIQREMLQLVFLSWRGGEICKNVSSSMSSLPLSPLPSPG